MTTVPMSRPSATQSPSAISRCCWATIARRTAGSAATTRDASTETSGARIASVTSSPSSSTRSPSEIVRPAATAAASPPDPQACERHAPIHRAGVEVGEAELGRDRLGDASTCPLRLARRSRSPSAGRLISCTSRPGNRPDLEEAREGLADAFRFLQHHRHMRRRSPRTPSRRGDPRRSEADPRAAAFQDARGDSRGPHRPSIPSRRRLLGAGCDPVGFLHARVTDAGDGRCPVSEHRQRRRVS